MEAECQTEMGFHFLDGKTKPRDVVGVKRGGLVSLDYF